MDNDKWFAFMAKANEQLLKKTEIGFGSAFITLIIEPSFHNHFRFFINWNDEKESVIWEKLTWEKLVDAPKFYDELQISKGIIPTMSIQKGIITKDKISTLIDAAKSLVIKPQLNPERMWTLDGAFYTLQIGRSSDFMTFSWHTLPEGWEELKSLIDEILAVEELVIKV
jgi:hypothetical protein